MTLERARYFLSIQAGFGGDYNAESAKLVLGEMRKDHGQAVVDRLIAEYRLDKIFGFEPGMWFEGGAF